VVRRIGVGRVEQGRPRQHLLRARVADIEEQLPQLELPAKELGHRGDGAVVECGRLRLLADLGVGEGAIGQTLHLLVPAPLAVPRRQQDRGHEGDHDRHHHAQRGTAATPVGPERGHPRAAYGQEGGDERQPIASRHVEGEKRRGLDGDQ
jgi:hypothetical protein